MGRGEGSKEEKREVKEERSIHDCDRGTLLVVSFTPELDAALLSSLLSLSKILFLFPPLSSFLSPLSSESTLFLLKVSFFLFCFSCRILHELDFINCSIPEK